MKSKAIFTTAFIKAAKRYNLVALDIGARNGFDEDLLSISPSVSMIGFEPEATEATRIESQGDSRWRSVKIVAKAVGGQNTTSKLYIPPNKAGASILPHNPDMIDQYGYEELHGVDSCCEVETVTLDKLLADKQLSKASYLKVDVEGAELAVFIGGEKLLQSTLAVKVEVSFLEQRVKQPLVWNVVDWMQARGFECIDVIDVHRWRRRSVPAHPYRSKFIMPYSKGRLSQCDLMFFKTPSVLKDDDQKIEYALLAAAMGYFDQAVSMIRGTPSISELWLQRHGFELEEEIINASKEFGCQTSWSYLAKSIRLLIPAFRSALFGLPFKKPRRPY